MFTGIYHNYTFTNKIAALLAEYGLCDSNLLIMSLQRSSDPNNSHTLFVDICRNFTSILNFCASFCWHFSYILYIPLFLFFQTFRIPLSYKFSVFFITLQDLFPPFFVFHIPFHCFLE